MLQVWKLILRDEHTIYRFSVTARCQKTYLRKLCMKQLKQLNDEGAADFFLILKYRKKRYKSNQSIF